MTEIDAASPTPRTKAEELFYESENNDIK